MYNVILNFNKKSETETLKTRKDQREKLMKEMIKSSRQTKKEDNCNNTNTQMSKEIYKPICNFPF